MILLFAMLVSLDSLLDEMSNRGALARDPEPSYSMRLWSSYDRRTVTPDDPEGWFANADFSCFVRVETNGVRREAVLVDAKGPGAIVRFWQTFANTGMKGVLRFYIDGKLEAEGVACELVGGTALCGAPLSESLSPLTPLQTRGHNLYLPIPYAVSCKVTYESDELWKSPDKMACEYYYYNIETRSYPEGTAVESFSRSVLERMKERVSGVNSLLLEGTSDSLPTETATLSVNGLVPPGDVREIVLSGPAAIASLSFEPVLESKFPYPRRQKPEVLDDLVIEFSFDGEKTVSAPCGYFFGTGWIFSPYQSRFLSVEKDSLLTSRWMMPYARDVTLTFRNVGTEPIRITRSSLVTVPWEWDSRSLHFGLTHRAHRRISTVRNGYPWDAEYAALKGHGRLVGSTTSVLNPYRNWWGEGDEKIWIDGETFPSYVGTGTEDYYGYAWCNGNVFEHPFLAQPCGQGAGASGFAVNVRTRALDSIPFERSLKFDMEVFHHRRATIDYVSTTYWYLKPDCARSGRCDCVAVGLCAASGGLTAARDWLEVAAKRVVTDAERRMDSGLAVYNPDVGGTYRATWLRDYVYMLEADAVPHDKVNGASRLFMDAVSTKGWGVDCVKYDGTPVYQPGYGTMGRLAVADGSPFTVAVAYLSWKNTGSQSWLAPEVLTKLERTMAAAPFGADGLLAYISPQEKWERAAFGFTDCVHKKGSCLFESLLLYEAEKRLAEMFRAAGDVMRSDSHAEHAASIARAVNRVFWDEGAGLYRAATAACREHDVWGSAFAVWLGVADGVLADRVSETLARNYRGLVSEGQVRHNLPGKYWEVAGCGRDCYQNGGYWGTPVGWIAWALERTAPALVDQMYAELVADYREHGICEWRFETKRACNRGYPASVCLPLVGVRRILGVRKEGCH